MHFKSAKTIKMTYQGEHIFKISVLSNGRNLGLGVISDSYTDDVVAFQWNKDAPIVLREGIEMPKFYYTDKPATNRCDSTYAGGNARNSLHVFLVQ